MPAYDYSAMDGGGKEKKGSIAADSERDAAAKLKQLGLFPTMINEKKGQITNPLQPQAMSPPPVQESLLDHGQTTEPVDVAPSESVQNPTPLSTEDLVAIELGSLPGIFHIPVNKSMTLCGEEIENSNSVPINECMINCPSCRRTYQYCIALNIPVTTPSPERRICVNEILSAVRKVLKSGFPLEELVEILEALHRTYHDLLQGGAKPNEE